MRLISHRFMITDYVVRVFFFFFFLLIYQLTKLSSWWNMRFNIAVSHSFHIFVAPTSAAIYTWIGVDVNAKCISAAMSR